MYNNFDNKKLKYHLLSLLIISLFYLIPYLLVQNFVLYPYDVLDNEIVFNKIIGEILKGNHESINIFLAGEIEWFYLRRILQPLTFLYAFMDPETAFWFTNICVKLLAYFLFYKLSLKLNCTHLNSALISCIYASAIQTHFGLGLVCFPYLIYLFIKNKEIKIKNYIIIAIFALNTDLAYHVFILPLAFVLAKIIYIKNTNLKYKNIINISLIFIFFLIISNLNLIYAQLFDGPFHRSEWITEVPILSDNIKELIFTLFSIPIINNTPYFFHSFPLKIYYFSITLLCLFSLNKKTLYLLLTIFVIVLVNFILQLDFINEIRANNSGIFRSINWNNIEKCLPVIYCLMFVSLSNLSIVKKTKFFIYPIIFFCLISLQISTSIVPISKHFLSFDYLTNDQQTILRGSFKKQEYKELFNNFIEFKKDLNQKYSHKFKSKYTFSGYYDYENYKFIKSIVKDKRTISIKLDPMVAAMNNINVIDGYHNLYPLFYKKKFRKIIEDQLDHYPNKKKYYDYWGSRVYTFVSDPNIIKVNFNEAKILGADYVISGYTIKSNDLELICANCNNSKEIFLYKILEK